MRPFLLFLIGFICPILLKAQAIFDKDKLDQYLDTLANNNKFMGSISIFQNNKNIYQKAVGYSNLTLNEKATFKTQYNFSHLAQMLTTVLILKAEEEGKLKLTDKLNLYLPQLANSEQLNIADILYHQSGITNFTKNLSLSQEKSYSKKDILKIIKEQKIERLEVAEYAAENYILLAFILEKAYGKSYTDLVEKYIIKPLKLENISLINGENNLQEALPYYFIGDWMLLVSSDNSIYYHTKSLAANTADMAKFIDGLFNGLILKYETLKKYPIKEKCHLLRLEEFKYKETNHLYYMANNIDETIEFTTQCFYLPKLNASIVIASNGINYYFDKITEDILAAFLNEPYKIPEFNRPQVYTPQELRDFTGFYKHSDYELNFKIIEKDGQLIIQMEGEPMIDLSSIAYNTFSNDLAELKLVFDLNKDYIILQKGDNKMLFYKYFNF